jgi:hypothetical protein
VNDPATYWNLSTTATYTDSIEVCVTYDEGALPGSESLLAILHYDTTLVPADFTDITVSVDTLANVICGRTATLSPFVLAVSDVQSGVDDGGQELPSRYTLYQNVPNPFNPTTTIRYNIAADVHVRLVIFDVAGRVVRRLVDENQQADSYAVTWDGVNDTGQAVATGIYFYRIEAGGFLQTKKMLLLK